MDLYKRPWLVLKVNTAKTKKHLIWDLKKQQDNTLFEDLNITWSENLKLFISIRDQERAKNLKSWSCFHRMQITKTKPHTFISITYFYCFETPSFSVE